MQVDPIHHSEVDMPARVHTSAAPRPLPAVDHVNFQVTEGLHRSLEEQPAVRAAEVERGRKLMVDVQYPPAELIRRISRLLAGISDDGRD